MHTLCVTSGKGGVGKTTLSINLGIAIARTGRRVLMLDGDLGLANLNVMLGIIPKLTIHDVVRGHKTLSEIVMKTDYGIDLIAGASGIAELANLGETERQNVMRDLEGLGGYDVLIIDTGAGIGDNVVRFVLAADDALIVTTPHPTSLTDAYGIIKTVLAEEAKPLKLLVNCATSANDARRIASRLTGVTDKFMHGSLECIGYVPVDPLIEKSILAQKPHLILNPRSASAQRINEAAMRLIKHDNNLKSSLGRFLRKLIGH
ncbi:Cobyrinic acid ac-diamide synthase [Thiorhodococcus drewsii AZ1]|uniref:Cobyrinic acid ac-diamide synthase n=1 Tax=Thiorhodococcus drewsii AZ1 TaxID=765913 RepID=G2DXE9_9GAMM|nr:MinD/ParA family protein [Thiorhodococcus drewsii]EGV33181.1 Cobyrinic acid ac-diamide synthase [Thiorhodococcus drewsii AZ1]